MLVHRNAAYLLVLVSLSLFVSLSTAGIPGKKKIQDAQRLATSNSYAAFLINNIFNYYGNNGDGSCNPHSSDGEGFEYPIGLGKHCVYEDGVVWGGFVNDSLRVGGSTYWHGIQPGRILPSGLSDDGTLPNYRVYRVRSDVKGGSNGVDRPTQFADIQSNLSTTEVPFLIRYENVSAQSIYSQYVNDWNEWPADQGAPFTDVDGNGVYDPNIDIPGRPGADQTLWYVGNDLNASLVNTFTGSLPIGLEMRKTIWGYRRPGPAGNVIFASTILINRSGSEIDSMFLVQWADPDLGYGGDDLLGCDSARSLGYVYNSPPSDAEYGTAVPAAGFDLLQGPMVPSPGDSAIFQGMRRYGAKNLPLSAFDFISPALPVYTDPVIGLGADVQWYNLMNGLIGTNGEPYINPNTNQPTKFCFTGDPVTFPTPTGWLDGEGGLTPTDYRMCLVTGSFKMAPGDTQELVVANIVGLGTDRLSSITTLRWNDDRIQEGYNNLFRVAAPPPPPQVKIAELNQEIALTWGEPAAIAATEGRIDNGFQFEGYKVYEFPGPSATEGMLVGTYDVKNGITTISDTIYDPSSGLNLVHVVEQGSDNGIIHALDFHSSAITGKAFLDGSKYYFAVTAYSHNFNPSPLDGTHALEDPIQVLSVMPHLPNPGIRYQAAVGDAIGATHTGPSDGTVTAKVVNPLALRGGTYKVVFSTNGGSPVWQLLRTFGSTTDTLAKNQIDQTGTEGGAIVVDGIQFSVRASPDDFKTFLVTSNASGALNPPQAGAFGFNSSAFPLGPPLPFGTDRPDGTLQQSRTAGLSVSQGWGIGTGMYSPTMDPGYLTFVTRVTNGGARWPRIVGNDFEIRFTPAGGKALIPADLAGFDKIIDVPFELWCIPATGESNAYRMFPNILDVDGNLAWNLLTKVGTDSVDNGGGGPDHSISGGDNDPFTDWFYWVDPVDHTPGHAGYDAILLGAQAAIAGNRDPYLAAGTNGDVMQRMVLVAWNMGSTADPTAPANYTQRVPESGTIFRLVPTKPNSSLDEFDLIAPSVTQDKALAQADVTKITVFPNPYMGINPQETDVNRRWVTFTHLPTKATIRIFTLAGTLVQTILKDDQSQFAQWDLRNEHNRMVASGMYIVYIDMPDLGSTKTLKLAVIPIGQ